MTNKAFLMSIGLFFSYQATAQELTPQSLFNRCYTQLTARPVPLNHPLMKQVISGQISPINACKEVLRKAQLTSTGELQNTADLEARAVLNTFNRFHQSWFDTNNFDTTPGYSVFENNGNVEIYDATEPALAITYAMFGKNQPYSSVLTRSTGVTAIRTPDPIVEARFGWLLESPIRGFSNQAIWESTLFTFRDATTASTTVSRNIQVHVSQKLAMPKIESGTLVGVKPTTQSFMVPNISLLGDRPGDKGVNTPNLKYSYDFFKTYGGGVLGTPIYILQYYGHPTNMQFNGQSKLARRWSQQNMNTFLCASLPTLRESDIAKSMIDPNSSAAFRQSTSCLRCHATLDPMAYTARNLTVGNFDALRPTDDGVRTRDASGQIISPPPAFSKNAIALTSYHASKDSVTGWPSAPVTDFHLQQPSGKLFFRSLTGALVNKSVSDISDLGVKMTETDDYYLCAAKRYFEFMTGIVVPLYDKTNPANAGLNLSLSDDAKDHRAFVEDLAQSLKSSGSVIQVVDDIMGSKFYNKENFR